MRWKGRIVRTLRGVARRVSPPPRRYHLTVSNESRFVWFRVAKVGTRTIYHELGEAGVRFDVDASFVPYSPSAFEDHFKFAFVRNPWDRLVSCWHDKVLRDNYFRFDETTWEKMKDFESFLEFVSCLDIESCDRHLRAQSQLIALDDLDHLGRLETFRHDLDQIFAILGIEGSRSEPRNVSSQRDHYRDYYTEETSREVGRIYRRDIQIFGYEY